LTQIFTVTELNSRISDRLEGDLRLHDLWARGEVSNYVHHRSGHRYFTLKDRNPRSPASSSEVTAALWTSR